MVVLVRWLLIAGLLVTTPLLMYLSAAVFRTKQAWLREVTKNEAAVETLTNEVTILKVGGPDARKTPYAPEMGVPTSMEEATKVGLKQIQAAQNWWGRDRGRIFDGTPGALDAATGGTTIAIDTPRPHQIAENATLYIFDSREKAAGGRYIGAFRVKAVKQDDTTNTIDVVPAYTLTDNERQQLTVAVGAGARWIICASMPTDRHVTFQGKTPEEMQALMPASTAQEYIRDGSDAQPNDPPEHVVGGKYVRPLREYAQLFHTLRAQRPRLDSALLAITNDSAAMIAAKDLLDAQMKARMEEETKVTDDVKKAQEERDSVKQVRDALVAEIKQLQEENAALVLKNRQLAADIVKAQERSVPKTTTSAPIPAVVSTSR